MAAVAAVLRQSRAGARATSAPVASAAVTLSPSRAAGGTPVAGPLPTRGRCPGASMPAGEHVVFVHCGRCPAAKCCGPTITSPRCRCSSGKPGTPVEYDRTMFVPRISVAGPVQVLVGLYSPASGRARAAGRARPSGTRAYPRGHPRDPARPLGGVRGLRRGLAQPGGRGDAGARVAVVAGRRAPGVSQSAAAGGAVARARSAGDEPVRARSRWNCGSAAAVVDTFTLTARHAADPPDAVDRRDDGRRGNGRAGNRPQRVVRPGQSCRLSRAAIDATLGVRVFNAHLARPLTAA